VKRKKVKRVKKKVDSKEALAMAAPLFLT
jgi:hypothetical protein